MIHSRLYGDDLRIKQILNNLLSNAIKYTKEGEISFPVSRADETVDAGKNISLRFVVRDTGIGIKADDLEKIFPRFDQVSGAERENIEWAGLGLAITRQLAELMGGSISVENEYGKGSVFSLTISQTVISPEQIDKEIAYALKTLNFKERGLDKGNFKRSQMPEARVLVVDDVPSNLDVARGFLSLYGMKVDCTESEEQAIRILREKASLYVIVLMDQMMPGIDGTAVLKTLRGKTGGVYAGSLPVIALSANALLGADEIFMEM
jgi:CheY-like chemotaxis protein/anti-sigma regulatory factor (Ser/Thr protein kinase)